MGTQTRELWMGDRPRAPIDEHGVTVSIPSGWDHLPPGDATLTRRVKAAGPSWVIKAKRGKRVMSQGIWAPSETIAEQRARLELERQDPKYQRKLDASRRRRAEKEAVYAQQFAGAVAAFLDFHPRHRALQNDLARAIAVHATPVGSGTVARTQRIPVERRAEAATIAWLRHHTTGYDDMRIPRVKGMRREVRRMLAERSRTLLQRYRHGDAVACCPLSHALEELDLL